MRKDLAKEILKVERVKTAIDAWYEERKGKVPKNPPNLRRYKLHPVWDKVFALSLSVSPGRQDWSGLDA